jgi:hypothetical protein
MARSVKPTVAAHGRVFHKFHGTYWCFVVLIFKSAQDANAALPKLKGFEVSDNATDALVRTASGKDVKRTMRMLERWRTGDKTHAVDGVPFSIDCGPEFTIAVPVDAQPVQAVA